jgi:hypothetical protein
VPAVPHIGVSDGMTESPLHHDHRLLASGFFSPREKGLRSTCRQGSPIHTSSRRTTSTTPNPAKIALFLEEAGLPYEAIPVDTSRASSARLHSERSIRTARLPLSSTPKA